MLAGGEADRAVHAVLAAVTQSIEERGLALSPTAYWAALVRAPFRRAIVRPARNLQSPLTRLVPMHAAR